jgi:hypothetical protein
LGRAFYNFAYLESIAVWTIARLSPEGYESVPKGKATAGNIASKLKSTIATATPPLEETLRFDLLRFHKDFEEAIDSRRNKLLHARPYTPSSGAQQLLYQGGPEWPIEEVYAAAKFFEDVALMGIEIFYGDLAKARPKFGER